MTTGYHPNCVCFHYHKVPISGALFFVFSPESVEHVTDTCSLASFFHALFVSARLTLIVKLLRTFCEKRLIKGQC